MLSVFKGVEKSFEKLHTAGVIIYCNILLLRITNECVNSLDMSSQIISPYKLALLHGAGGSFMHFSPLGNLCPSKHGRAVKGLRSLVALYVCWTGTEESSG